MKTTNQNRVGKRIVARAVAAAIAGGTLAGARFASAEAIDQWLFDNTNSYTAVNSNAGHLEPWMQKTTAYFTNLHVAGGPFGGSVGAMSLPTAGGHSAQGGAGTAIDWTLGVMQNFTIEMWVNPSQLTGGLEDVFNYRGQLLRLAPAAGGLFLQGYIHSGSTFYGGTTGSILVPTNVWSHIAMTYDGANIRTYINGTPDTTVPVVTGLGNYAISPYGPLVIGQFNVVNDFLGLVDEIRVSNVALPSGSGSGWNELAWNHTLIGIPLPEPSVMGLTAVGLGALLFRMRRG